MAAALPVASLAASAFSAYKSLTAKAPTPPPTATLPAAPPSGAALDQQNTDIVSRIRRRNGAGATGRTATLLTGASGLAAPASVQGKALLGS
jgi:hypothetical protein